MDASSTKSSFLCRQSSTRWIPTPDQIRILRDLYYNNGVRSPTAEQIQRITARLRQYGKIEGKNVFYWFQNHKARERQKKKLTMEHHVPTVTANADGGVHSGPCNFDGNKLTTNNTSNFDVPCHGFYDVGNGYGGGPVLMERSLIRESCLSGGGDGFLMDGSNMGWMGVEPTVAPWMYHNIKEKEPLVSTAAREIETLLLFPTRSREQEEESDDGDEHGEQHRNFGASLHHHDHYGNGVGGASLELTLNSYGCAPPGSM